LFIKFELLSIGFALLKFADNALNIPDAYIMARGGWSSPAVMQSVYRHALADHVSVTDLLAVSAFQNPFQDNPAIQ
jgi:hypothetical protein